MKAQLLLGSLMARRLKAKVGDELSLISQAAQMVLLLLSYIPW